MARGPGKYGNVRTEAYGLVFDSAKEAKRWGELLLLQRAGAISNLTRQTKYPLCCGRDLICFYVSDFDYDEKGEPVTEDTKGFTTPEFKLKAKLFKSNYGREIKIT